MEYTKLGSTGLDISRLCLGCMTFGQPDAGAHPWTLAESDARPIFRHAVEQGINFFDTANSYSAGTSEEMVGKFLKEFTQRDEVVLATKVFFPPAGRLARPVGESSHRNETDTTSKMLYAATEEADNRVIGAVEQIAAARGVPMAQIGLAWVMNKQAVSAPIVGASKTRQLDDAIAALEIKLAEDEIAALEKEYVPHAVTGHN